MIIHGVDMGAADEGGLARVRVASRSQQDKGKPVRLERTDRQGLLRLIRASAGDGSPHLWRVNAAMGLPSATVLGCSVEPAWKSVAQWMREFGSARAWRSAIRVNDRTEPRRLTDRDKHTPLAPMNLRCFKRTWSFMTEVLLPLSEEGAVSIQPCVPRTATQVILVEGCPSAVLRSLGSPIKGFTGSGEGPARVRRAIVERLEREGLSLDTKASSDVFGDETGGALAAVLMCADGSSDCWAKSQLPAEAAVEGWIC